MRCGHGFQRTRGNRIWIVHGEYEYPKLLTRRRLLSAARIAVRWYLLSEWEPEFELDVVRIAQHDQGADR